MDKIKKNFGFGCMRLPMIGEDVDIEQTRQMVDLTILIQRMGIFREKVSLRSGNV